MRVPRDNLPPLKHELRQILEGQGPEACKQVLESQLGTALREHARSCAECNDIVRELYRDGDIPINY